MDDADLLYIQMRTLEDIVKLVSFSSTPIIQHTTVQGREVYFIQSVHLIGKPLIYLYQAEEKIKRKYIVYNRFNDDITFSDQPGSDGQSIYIPIIEVEKTNLLNRLP